MLHPRLRDEPVEKAGEPLLYCRSGIEQLANGECVLKARVRAPPSEGEANAALVKLIAKTLRVPPRDVHLVAGLSARVKRVKIVGAAAALSAALTKICARK